MENLSFEIEAKLKKLNKGLDKASSQIDSFAKKNEARFKKFGERAGKIGQSMSVAITLPLAALGAASVKAASDFEETESKFNTVFGNIQKDAKETADELRNSYGLSGKASLQLLSDTGDLLTGFGFTQQSALDLSNEVNKLAVDLASFTNFSGGAKGASQALTKALLGERESVKSLGISILEADVKAQVLANTKKGLTFETERQAKAFATLELAQEQSKNAIGDYERTSDSFANQMRLLQSRVGELSVEFGKILLPLAEKLVKATQKLVKWFSDLDDSTKKIIAVVAGLAAALGPLLVVIGGIATALPSMIAGFAKMKLALAAISGPIGLTIAAISGLVVALMALNRQNDETSRKISTLAQIRAKALQSIAKEKSQVELLVAIAKDENFSKKRRIEAIKELNKISPQYLGDLKLETINTDNARIAIEKYNKAIEKRAIVKAAEAKLQELANKKIERELAFQKQQEKNKQAEIDLSKKTFDNAQAEAFQKKNLANANEINKLSLESLNNEYEKERDLILGIIKDNDKLIDSRNKVANTTNNNVNLAPQAPSIQSQGAINTPLPGIGQIQNNIPNIITATSAAVQAETAIMTQNLQDFANSANDIIQNNIANTFAGLGEIIGNALSGGGNVLQNVGALLLGTMGNLLTQLGKQAIVLGLTLEGVKKALLSFGGIGAIAIGTVAVALGKAFSNKAASLGQSLGNGSGGTGATTTRGGVDNNFSQSFAADREIILRARGRDLVAVLNAQNNFNNALG